MQVVQELLFLKREKMQCEIDASNNHEHDGDRFHLRTIEVGQAAVMGWEASDRYGAEAMGDCIEQAHANSPIGQCTNQGKSEID